MLEQVLVRNGYNWNLPSLILARTAHRRLRHLLDVLEHAAERERWGQLDRCVVAETLLDFSREQKKLASLQELEVFPQILKHLDPTALAELTAQLERFDSRSDARVPNVDADKLCEDVMKRCAVQPKERLGVLPGSERARPAAMAS